MPTYSGQLAVECVGSLLANLADLSARGIQMQLSFEPGLCYVGLARNHLVTDFRRHEASPTHLIYWDDDVAPPPDGVWQLMSQNVGLVAGIYPAKTSDKERYPYRTLPEPRRQGRLLETDGLPTGFMCIRRDVIERLIERYPERRMVDPMSGREDYNLFSCEMVGTTWWGEDYRFCQLVRSIGEPLWCLPDMDMRHVGRNVWRGNLQKHIDA